MKKILLIICLLFLISCNNQKQINNAVEETHCLPDSINWTESDMKDFAADIVKDMATMIPKYTWEAKIDGYCVTVIGK